MSKIVLSGLSPKELRQALSGSRSVITETKRQLAAETRVLSYKEMADRNREKLGKQVNALTKAFASYVTRVQKIGDKSVSIVNLVTPEVVTGLVKPFKDFLKNEFGSSSIDDAIDGINEKRRLDIEKYGSRRDGIIDEINSYYDSKIELYLKPLQVLEAQLNSLSFTKDAVKELPSIGDRITRYLTTAEVVEPVTEIVVEQPAMTVTKRQGKRSIDKVAK